MSRNEKLYKISDDHIKDLTIKDCENILHSGYFKICDLWKSITKQKNSYGVSSFINDIQCKIVLEKEKKGE